MMDAAAPATDESWVVLRAQGGSREHLERLIALTQEFLEPRLGRMFDERADAEDVLQDVLFVICRRLWTLSDVHLFRPWAHRIAMRTAWKALNRRRREFARMEAVEPDTIPSAIPNADGIDLDMLLKRVSPSSRVVMVLHYLEGFTLEAVAAELDVALGTVKSRLAYGLTQLRSTSTDLGRGGARR